MTLGSTPKGSPASSGAEEILVELLQLLAAEKAALARLDRDAIDAHAARKLELDARLREVVGQTPLQPQDKLVLERVRQAALENQLLLAHARSCVQGVLSLLSPGNAPAYAAPGYSNGAHSSPPPPPIALNLRR